MIPYKYAKAFSAYEDLSVYEELDGLTNRSFGFAWQTNSTP